jgi:hypothetical protein
MATMVMKSMTTTKPGGSMQSKPTNRWIDVQIVIITLTMTLSLFLWNLFAGSDRQGNMGTAPSTQGVNTLAFAPSQPRVRILLGGKAPQAPSQFSSRAPAPVTITGSSR